MAYLLIEKLNDGTDLVVLGPMEWRPRFFQSCLRDDLEIDFFVPLSNDTNEAIIVNEIARIVPVADIGIVGEYNPKIQHLAGPYYNIFDTRAESYHTVQDKSIDLIKDELKLLVAANRYRYEIIGTPITIQSVVVPLLTTREDRGLYLQTYQLGKDLINWKFGSIFLTVSNADLKLIVDAISSHIQAAFDWESLKIAEMNGLTTIDQLNNMSLVSDNVTWEPTQLGTKPNVL
jgi:hypothetical protein